MIKNDCTGQYYHMMLLGLSFKAKNNVSLIEKLRVSYKDTLSFIEKYK